MAYSCFGKPLPTIFDFDPFFRVWKWPCCLRFLHTFVRLNNVSCFKKNLRTSRDRNIFATTQARKCNLIGNQEVDWTTYLILTKHTQVLLLFVTFLTKGIVVVFSGIQQSKVCLERCIWMLLMTFQSSFPIFNFPSILNSIWVLHL